MEKIFDFTKDKKKKESYVDLNNGSIDFDLFYTHKKNINSFGYKLESFLLYSVLIVMFTFMVSDMVNFVEDNISQDPTMLRTNIKIENFHPMNIEFNRLKI